MKRGQDLKGNPSLLAGRNIGPRYSDGKSCIWCETLIFTSQGPKPRGRGKWVHGSGCDTEPKAFELDRWARKRIEVRGVEITDDAVRSEIEAFQQNRDEGLLIFFASALGDEADEDELKQLHRSLPEREPTDLLLQAMEIAGDTETVQWLRGEHYFGYFDTQQDDHDPA